MLSERSILFEENRPQQMQALIREVSINLFPALAQRPHCSQSMESWPICAPPARRLENLANGWSTWGSLEGRAGGACYDLDRFDRALVHSVYPLTFSIETLVQKQRNGRWTTQYMLAPHATAATGDPNNELLQASPLPQREARKCWSFRIYTVRKDPGSVWPQHSQRLLLSPRPSHLSVIVPKSLCMAPPDPCVRTVLYHWPDAAQHTLARTCIARPVDWVLASRKPGWTFVAEGDLLSRCGRIR